MTMLCGAGIAVPVDKELPENEIENVIRRAKASAVIFSTKKSDAIKKIEEKLPEVQYFIQMNSDSEISGKNVGMDCLIKQGRQLVEQGDNSFMDIKVDPDEFKVLIFTSGTTSNSKGVMLCNRNLAANINAVLAYVKLYPSDRFMSILPLHHTYESTIGFLLPFAIGGSVAVCQGLKYIVPNLQETKPTALLTVPLLVENLYKKINANIKKSKKENMVNSMIHVTNALKAVGVDIKKKVFNEIHENLGGNLKYIVSAAAPIDAKIGNWIEDIGIIFLQGYGLTETAPIAALTPEFDAKIGSEGKAVVGEELKIDNPNENGEGEILIKSQTLMLGYYEDEDATNKVIKTVDGERWFYSGDIGYLDDEGFLYITGRCKNVIVTQNGKNIYPEEIELLLGDIPEIKESLVYGKEPENDRKDEKELIISAKVIPNYEEIEKIHGKGLTEEQVYNIIWEKVKSVNKKLTSYKAIKNLEIKHEEFEKDVIMVPDPCYASYLQFIQCSGAKAYPMPLTQENNYKPDVEKIYHQIIKDGYKPENIKALFINYPNNPLGTSTSREYVQSVINFCKKYDILLVSDAAYCDMYFTEEEKPFSIFELDGAKDIGIEFYSF